MALGIGDQLNQLMGSLQISCYHIGALPPCHPPYHDSQHKRGQQERGGNTTVAEQCWVGRNTVEKTQSRCVATPGAHTTIFLGPQVVPQQWGKATTMGKSHNNGETQQVICGRLLLLLLLLLLQLSKPGYFCTTHDLTTEEHK